MDVYVVTATYGPDSDIDPLVAVAYTREAALEEIQAYVEIHGRETFTESDPDLWIVGEPSLLHIAGEEPKVTPPWRTDLFTEAESKSILEMAIEDVRDALEDWAEVMCDEMSLVECIGYLDEDNDETIDFLKSIRDNTPLSPGNWQPIIEFCKRFGLINEEPALTPRGFSYLTEWGP